MDSAGLRWYRTGTVDITQGSANVTGVGTNWQTAGIQPGDVFMVGNSVLYEIAQVVSNTSIALHSAFQGATGTAQNYSILRNFAGTMQAQIAAQVSELVNKYESYIDTELQQIVGPAGPTSFPYMGAWATGRQYNALDVVEYSGALYMAIAGHTSTIDNAPGATNTEWVPLAVSLSGTALTEFANGASVNPNGANGISIVGKNANNDVTLSAAADAIRLQQTTGGTTTTLATFPANVITTDFGNGSGFHNSIFRGKNLGTSVTDSQWAAIGSGTFDDLWIGDYWNIGGVNWRIADFDYYFRSGDQDSGLLTHHVVIVPDATLYNAQMNETDTTEGGYLGSKMYTANLAQAKTQIQNAFGAAHILTHREIADNAMTNGRPTGYAYYNATVELMTESMVCGGRYYGVPADPAENPMMRIYTMSNSQLNLFRLRHDLTIATNRMWYWLRDPTSAQRFARCDGAGNMANGPASASGGVRPAFLIAA